MNLKSTPEKNEEQFRRRAESLKAMARERGDGEAVALRALELSRQLNVAPWIALAVAERLVTLKEAQLLDRAGRCKELQSAVLDKRRSLSELKVLLPYAAHFLAAEVSEAQPGRKWDMRVVIRILDKVLSAEMKTEGEELSLRVRTRPFAEYVSVVECVLAIMRRTRCEVGMALDVEAGGVAESFATDYIQRKRALENEERRMMSPPVDVRNRFPSRREYEPARRPVFQRTDARHAVAAPVRDHWTRHDEKKEPG